MKAEWFNYLNYKNNRVYKRPCCPRCKNERGELAPVIRKENRYECLNCHEVLEVDRKQKKFIDDSMKIKRKIGKCMWCGAFKMEFIERKDMSTGKWVIASGHCENCDTKMIV